MFALYTYIFLAVVVSFLCSLLEAVVLSVSSAQIGVLTKSGRRSGRILRDLKGSVDRPLAAILTLNTVANTLGAAGVGAQVLRVFGSEWVALASGLLTFVILVFSEIIPKTLGATYHRALAPAAAYAIKGLIFITYPAVLLSERISRLLSRSVPPERLTREEMIMVAELGETEGTLLQRETRIIRNLVRLDNIYVEDVMTPRSVVQALQKDQTVGDVIGQLNKIPFTRVPLFDKNLDEIKGFVHRFRILDSYYHGGADRGLEALARPIRWILPSKTVASALDEFIRLREHIFLVIDEYGGTEGIITLEDAIETLLGVEIVDEFDSVEDLRKLARAQWEQRKREHEI